MKKNILFLFFVLCLSKISFASQDFDKDIKKQIGQMLIIGFRDTQIDESSYISRAIKDLNLGGIVLFDIDVPTKSFPRNIINATQIKKLINDLKECSPSPPLMIAIDAEGGAVNRLKADYGFLEIPSHQMLGNINDINETYNVAFNLANQLSYLGINTNFAPVVDVNINPDNPVIGKKERSFSSDPSVVVAHAKAFIEAHHKHGIITAIKHFPGHGSSTADTHVGLVDVSKTYKNSELLPYKALIQNNVVDMIMTSHIIDKNYDSEYPVTLSKYYIRNILRKKFNFQGIVVSDDMQMGALTKHYSFKESIIRAINAGCDMLILSNNGSVYDENAPYEAVDIICNAIKEKKISKDRIKKSLQRIRTLKKRF